MGSVEDQAGAVVSQKEEGHNEPSAGMGQSCGRAVATFDGSSSPATGTPPMISFQRSIWLSGALLLGCADAPVDATGAGASGSGTTSAGPLGRVCNLPESAELHVVDIEASSSLSEELFFVLMSDQTALVFGDSLPPVDYGATAEEGDEPCLTQILEAGWTVGRSYEQSVTLIDYIPEQYGLTKSPATVDVPAPVAAVAYGTDVVAIDEQGGAWLLRKRFPEAGVQATGTFERLELPGRAIQADGDSGWCITLDTGRVWCMNRSLGPPRFGKDIGVGVPTELDVQGARSMVLSGFNSCWLDLEGATHCAGRSDFLILGYPGEMFPDFVREEYDVVPGLPPFERLWIKIGGACGVTEAGDLWCWGDNFWGQIDPDSDETALYPTLAGSFPGLKDVALSTDSICVLRADNIVVCRGLSQKSVPGACWGIDGWYRMPFAGPINCGEGI